MTIRCPAASCAAMMTLCLALVAPAAAGAAGRDRAAAVDPFPRGAPPPAFGLRGLELLTGNATARAATATALLAIGAVATTSTADERGPGRRRR